MIALARVLRPHGLEGSFTVALLTAQAERLEQVGAFRLGYHGEHASEREYRLTGVRTVGSRVVVSLEGIDTRDMAESLRGMLLLIPDDAVAPLPPGEYYAHQIVGCVVADESGVTLGTVTEVLDMPAQDVYVVRSPQRTWWLPAAKALIGDIDVTAKRITVRAIDGLFETGPAR